MFQNSPQMKMSRKNRTTNVREWFEKSVQSQRVGTTGVEEHTPSVSHIGLLLCVWHSFELNML
jgi:hypothetical protein